MAFLGVIALVIVCATFVVGGDLFAQNQDLVTVTTPATSTAVDDGTAILALLNQMQNIDLDIAIFSDPLFLNLTDFTVTLVEEPKSRPNPFAPIGQDVMLNLDSGTSIETSPFSASSTSVNLSPFGLPAAPSATGTPAAKAPVKTPVKP